MAALYIVTWLQTKNYGLNGTDVVCDLASTRTFRRPVRVFKSQIVKWGSVQHENIAVLGQFCADSHYLLPLVIHKILL